MFDILPNLLSSIASFLFPLFASYKALKTSDPAQLTPWLMYWSVLSCVFLVESWAWFILFWVPFYSYMRLFFLLYLVLPQTQGARHLYETYLHPYLEENETAIEEFIASAHDRLKTAGLAYLKQAIELIKVKVLGMPPGEPEREEEPKAAAAPQTFTQTLLARFSMPAARWAADNAGTAGQDFFNMLAGAVGAASGSASTVSGTAARNDMPGGRSLVPENLGGAQEKMTFIAAQKERLAFMLGALEREAQQLERTEEEERRVTEQAREGPSRPPSGHSVWSALSKSRSEVDFEKIDAESGAEEDEGAALRRRGQPSEGAQGDADGPKPWNFLGWGVTGGVPPESGRSSGFEK
ncbi:hypothetical protein DL767_003588 [Monosporascus sp. MG133]|nr:hypothetical protein DL767_003588 [Monosporascus sp. MG133]